MRVRILALGLLAVTVLTACSSSGDKTGQSPTPAPSTGAASPAPGVSSPAPTPATSSRGVPPSKPASKPAGQVTVTGLVFRSEVEGGCTGLRGDDGKVYELLNAGGGSTIAAGARVRVTGNVRTDMATVCQIGTPFEVLSAERL